MKFLIALFTVCMSLSMASDPLDIRDETRLQIPKLINPCKGATVWMAPEKEVHLTWPTYGNLTQKTQATLMMPPEFEITFSPITGLQDARRLMHWMAVYDLSFMKPMDVRYLMDKDQRVMGRMLGRSFIANTDTFLELIAQEPDALFAQALLSQLAVEACKMGANQLNLMTEISSQELSTSQEDVGVDVLLQSAMTEMGFLTQEFGEDLDTGVQETLHTLNIAQPEHFENVRKPLEGLQTGCEKFQGYDISYLSTSFNFMVRDEDGVCLGGLCATFESDAARPYAHLSPFVMSEAVRYKGFGREMIALFESYVKSQGVGLIELDTYDFQAPRFYKANGYQRTKVLSNVFVGHQGQSYGVQIFMKTL